MIAIVDYGMGNLRSVAKGIERVGGTAEIVAEPGPIAKADKLILPGVGAFADAMEHLRQRDLVEPILDFIESDRPFLGICLGLQLLFSVGYEDGEYTGLGVIPGVVKRFDFADLPAGHDLAIPHMGWNAITAECDCPLLQGIDPGSYVYFVHSYHVVPEDPAVQLTWTDYGYRFTSSVRRGNVFATQFHPEKSQTLGLRILENFVGL